MAHGVADEPAELAAQRISKDEPWRWLEKGWADLWHRPALSLGYGLVFTLCGLGILMVLFQFHALALAPVLIGAFALIGPLLAVGLYEKSRRIEREEPLSAGAIMLVRTPAPLQLAYLGGLLMLVVLVWFELAAVLFALFFSESGLPPLVSARGLPPLQEWTNTLFYTPSGLTFLAIGSVVGGAIAATVFALTAVSVPALMHRRTDFVSAILVSLQAVRDNPWPMLLWAWLILIIIGFGLVTLTVGLIFTFPLIGHATWHAYRAIVVDR
jgi:uncharacterized membrane protein